MKQKIIITVGTLLVGVGLFFLIDWINSKPADDLAVYESQSTIEPVDTPILKETDTDADLPDPEQKEETIFVEIWCNCLELRPDTISQDGRPSYPFEQKVVKSKRDVIKTTLRLRDLSIEYLNEKSFCGKGKVEDIIYMTKTNRKPAG